MGLLKLSLKRTSASTFKDFLKLVFSQWRIRATGRGVSGHRRRLEVVADPHGVHGAGAQGHAPW